jgi:hypothetical protein
LNFLFKDIEDVDFTSNTRSIAVVWYGFHHQHGEIKFRVCLGTKPNICDILSRPEDYSHVWKLQLNFDTIISVKLWYENAYYGYKNLDDQN